MAKKKLNIKVAIIGSIALILFIMGAIVVVLHFNRNPKKFLKDAETALRQKDYKAAGLNYGRAYAYAKEDEFKIDVLFKFADFYLINSTDVDKEDPAFHEPEWNKALGCWNAVLNIDHKHLKAAKNMLEYFYEVAGSGAEDAWKTVHTRASELIDVMEEKDLPPDPYVLRAEARALLRMAALGQTTDRKKSLQEAVTGLKDLQVLTPKDIDVYQYLAQAAIIKGEIKSSEGVLDAKNSASEKMIEILQEAVEVAPDDPKAYANLLNARIAIVDKNDQEAMRSLEDEIEAAIEKLTGKADIYISMASFYMLKLETLDRAAEAVTKAIELDPENVTYTLTAANLYYRKASIYKDTDLFVKAIETVSNALSFPDAQDVSGPRQFVHKNNRLMIYSQLSNWYIELALQTEDEQEKQQWIAKAQETVYQVEQLWGTSDNLNVQKYHGMLALAKGDTTDAIRQMYDVYQQFKATRQNDPVLSYMLADIFKNSSEIGARKEFLESAILKRPNIVTFKPEALLDYAEVLRKLGDWKTLLILVDLYEQSYSVSERSRKLRIIGYIGAGMYDEAEERLSEWDPDRLDTVKLRLHLTNLHLKRAQTVQKQKEQSSDTVIKPSEKLSDQEETGAEFYQQIDSQTDSQTEFYQQVDIEDLKLEQKRLLEKLQKIEPESINTTLSLSRMYVKESNIEQARKLIDKLLVHSPDNLEAKLFGLILSEPDPVNVPADKQKQLTEQVLKGISDEYERAIALGNFYKSNGQIEEAIDELKRVSESVPDKQSSVVFAELFDLALQNDDMALAEQIVEKARDNNIDDCQGDLFAAKLDVVRKDYQGALERLNNCLETLPLLSYGYFLRSQVNSKLGNEDNAVEDAKTAVRISPLVGRYAKQMASVLYDRYLRLGKDMTPRQDIEVKQTLARAIALNQDDTRLMKIYANYIGKQDPDRALSILKQVQQGYPTVGNILEYAGMALKMSRSETDRQRREELLEIAGSAYRKAYEMKPENKKVVDEYSEYLRITGQQEKVAELFSEETSVLWKFYFRDGQYEKAEEILEKRYRDDPEDIVAIKGLMNIAVKTKSKEKIEKYSEELLAIKKTADNELLQIQNYIDADFLKEAILKLESFRERYPQESRAILFEAYIVMGEGQPKEVLELLDRYLKINPKNARAWLLRSRANQILGDFNQAIEDLLKSKNLDPTPTIRLRLAKVYEETGRMSAAIGELVEALKDEQAPSEAKLMLEKLYLQAGRKRELKEFYRKMIKKYPDNVFWRQREGRFYLYELKDYKQAENMLKGAWDMSQVQGLHDMMGLDLYLESLFQAKKYRKLVNYASRYLVPPYAPVAYAQMAQASFKTGSNALAVDNYRRALKECGDNDQLLMGILENMKETVGPIEVSKWCQEKLQEDPDSVSANLTMYNIAQKAGRFVKAIEYIDSFLGTIPPESSLWVEYMTKKAGTLSRAYVRTSNKKFLLSAISVFEKILDNKPDDPGVLNDLAYLLADNNEQLEKAVKYAKLAHEKVPNDGNILETYAYTLYKVGDYQKAEELFQMAIQIFERNSREIPWDLYWHLGMAQEKLEEKDQALESYKQALRTAGKRISPKNIKLLEESITRVSE